MLGVFRSALRFDEEAWCCQHEPTIAREIEIADIKSAQLVSHRLAEVCAHNYGTSRPSQVLAHPLHPKARFLRRDSRPDIERERGGLSVRCGQHRRCVEVSRVGLGEYRLDTPAIRKNRT